MIDTIELESELQKYKAAFNKLYEAVGFYGNLITQDDNGRLAKEALKALGREKSE